MDRTLARAVTDKKPVPEIDFTLHTMEDGSQVSTLERVIKGRRLLHRILHLVTLVCPPPLTPSLQRCRHRR